MDMDGAPPPEEDFSAIPPLERCLHKNWKARLSAYNELTSKFEKSASDDDPIFRPYWSGDLLKKWVTDANAASQEKGIEAVCSLLTYSGENAARTRADVVPGIVDKALMVTRSGTKKAALELCLLYIEVENTGEGVIADLLRGLDAKQPKLVAATVSTLKEVVLSFGVKPLGDIKPLVKSLTKIFAHSDKSVRAEGSLLAQALYQFLGPALTPSLNELKSVQLKELQESFAVIDGSEQRGGAGIPTRYTRAKQREMEAHKASAEQVESLPGANQKQSDDAPEPMDPLAFVEAVEISKIFAPDFLTNMSSAKWKDKQEACLAALSAIESNPKIKDDPALSEYAQVLGKKMSDTNVIVVTVSANLIAALAKAVENRGFGRYKPVLLSSILDRTKERKATVIEALAGAMDAIFAATSFSEILEDAIAASANKNPQVKEQSLKFLARCLSSTPTQPSKAEVKTCAEAQVALLGESFEPVRAAAAEGLGALMAIFGERALNPYMESVNDLQKAKVKEAFEKVDVKCKSGGGGAGSRSRPPAPLTSRPAVTAKPAEPSRQAVVNTNSVQTSSSSMRVPISAAATEKATSTPKPMPARVMTKKPVAASSKPAAVVAAVAKPKQGAAAAPSPSEPLTFKFSQEEAESQLEDIVPADLSASLGDAAWKVRVEGAEKMLEWIQGDGLRIESELLFRYFAKRPGWNEKIAQVTAKVFEIMAKIADLNDSFGRSSAAIAIPHLSEKLGDIKLKKSASDALIIFAEKTSLGFVLSQMYEPLGKLKAPRAQQDALQWLKQALSEFGIQGIALRDLVQFLKTNLKNANGGVRTSATATLVTLRLFVGPEVVSFLEDLNPQLLATINSEFSKVDGQAAPAPIRQSAELALKSGTAGAGSTAATAGEDALDDLIPRVDLDKIVAQTTVIADARSDSWKVRKESFEGLLALLESSTNSRLTPNLGELGGALKKGLADTNISVKVCSLAIVSKIAAGMGNPFIQQARVLTTPVANVLAEQKVTTRNAALDTLKAMADVCAGVEHLVPGLTTSLETNNPALRSAILGFIASRLSDGDSAKELQSLIPVTLSSLEDRNPDVRKAAQNLLPHLVGKVGFATVMEKVSGMKAASKATITPLVQSARANIATEPKSRDASASAVARHPLLQANKAVAIESSKTSSPQRQIQSKIDMRNKSMQTKTNALRGPAAIAPQDDTPTVSGPIRSKLSVPRPAPSLKATTSENPAPEAPSLPLFTTDPDARFLRARRDLVRWSTETATSAVLLDYLNKQMEGHISSAAQALLFSADRFAEKDHMAGLLLLDDMYCASNAASYGVSSDTLEAARIANIDLAIKYAVIRLHDGSTQMVLKSLDLIGHIVEFVDKTRSQSRGFNESEQNCLLPGLIYRLGDSKYREKLQTIFQMIDRTIPGSKIFQFYVEKGIASTNSKTKAASMEMVAQLIKRRGDVAASVPNSTKLYRRIAEQISSADPATRTAALDCVAYLHKYSGDSIFAAIGELKPKEKDLLRNRIDKLASSARGGPSQSALPSSNTGSPTASASPGARTVGSPSHSARGSPSRLSSEHAGPSAIPRVSTTTTNRSQALRSLQGMPPAPPRNEIEAVLHSIREDDADNAVDALKIAQRILENEAERIDGNAESLTEGITKQFGILFEVDNMLEEPKNFRLAKHLIQTLSNLCDRALLVESVSVPAMTSLLEQLTLGLLRTDRGSEQVKEMSKFINLTILRIFSAGKRITVFDALFQLLLRRSRLVTSPRDDLLSKHAELVLKCIWKRSRSALDDMKKGLLPATQLFQVLERFLQAIPPKQWRTRGQQKIVPGDMPLRTIKVLIQHVISIYDYEQSFQMLEEAFPGRADDTYIYEYLHRLYSAPENGGQGATKESEDRNPDRGSREDQMTGYRLPHSASSPRLEDPLQEDLRQLVKKASSASVTSSQAIPDLYAFLKRHPERQAQYEEMLDEAVGASSPYKLYIKRRLDALAAQEARDAGGRLNRSNANAEPNAPTIETNEPMQSGATSPTIDTDTRLEMLRNKFAYLATARSSVQQT